MIKGWKLNHEWVRLMDEKKKAFFERKMQRLQMEREIQSLKRMPLRPTKPGEITWL